MSNISNSQCPTGIDLLNSYVNIIAAEPHEYTDQEKEIAQKVETNLYYFAKSLTKAFTVKLSENLTSKRCQDLKEGFQNLKISRNHTDEYMTKKINYATLSSKINSTLPNVQKLRNYLMYPEKSDVIEEYLSAPQQGYESAIKILQDQASHNNYLSHYTLAHLYCVGLIGRLRDESPNYAQGLLHSKQGAQLGYAPALYNLALLYHRGDIGRLENGTPDYAQAQPWYEQATNLGHGSAPFNLAHLYDEGHIGCLENGAPNYAQAQRLYEQANELGTFIAATNLGLLYSQGFIGLLADGSPNYAQAQLYYERAAQKGSAIAADNLARLYERGHIGILADGTPNYAQAQLYYEQAAQQGNALAANNLAGLYERGHIGRLADGTPNYTQAMIWFRKARKDGSTDEIDLILNIQDPTIRRFCDYHFEFIKDDQWVAKVLQTEEGIDENLLRLIVFGTQRDDLLTQEEKYKILLPLIHSEPAFCSELVCSSDDDCDFLLTLARSLLAQRSAEAAETIIQLLPKSSVYSALGYSNLLYDHYANYFEAQKNAYIEQEQGCSSDEVSASTAESYAFANAFTQYEAELTRLIREIETLLEENKINQQKNLNQLNQHHKLLQSIVLRKTKTKSELEAFDDSLKQSHRPYESGDSEAKRQKLG